MDSIERRIERLESEAGGSAPDPAEWMEIEWAELYCRRRAAAKEAREGDVILPPGSTQWYGPDGGKAFFIRRDVEKTLPPLDPDCRYLHL